jgi:sugar phosphate isomerase/epimerase
MAKDPKGSLEKLAGLGYKEVETFGYADGKWWGMSAAELRSVLAQNGLVSPSGHCFPGGYYFNKNWEDGWKKAVDDARTLGQQYIVMPWLEEKYRRPVDRFKYLADELNKAAQISKAAGLQMAYHNHDFEFARQQGQTGYDILLKETDPSLLQFELDIYWAEKAGYDPVALFKAHPGRFALWHVKDMDKTARHFFTEVGNGVIDFKSIFAKAKESGMRHFFVEQDECPGSPFESIAQSITYLKKNIL